MDRKKEIVEALKKSLKVNGLTYAQVADKLKLSEISIKRNFSLNNFSLDRIEKICDLLNIDLMDLVRLADEERKRISSLTISQELELVSDINLFLVAICVHNGWQIDEITSYYDITKPECIRYLINLEHHKIINLLPNNRIQRLLAHDFHWNKNGPIERFFETTVQAEFMNSNFNDDGQTRVYLTGMLSINSMDIMQKKIESLAHEYALLQKEDSHLPTRLRMKNGLMIAFRPFELSVFEKLKRK